MCFPTRDAVADDPRVVDLVVDKRLVDLRVDVIWSGHSSVVDICPVALDHVVSLVRDAHGCVYPAYWQPRRAPPCVDDRTSQRRRASGAAYVTFEPARRVTFQHRGSARLGRFGVRRDPVPEELLLAEIAVLAKPVHHLPHPRSLCARRIGRTLQHFVEFGLANRANLEQLPLVLGVGRIGAYINVPVCTVVVGSRRLGVVALAPSAVERNPRVGSLRAFERTTVSTFKLHQRGLQGTKRIETSLAHLVCRQPALSGPPAHAALDFNEKLGYAVVQLEYL